MKYRIYRTYQRGPRRLMRHGLTWSGVVAWITNPEHHSHTATSHLGKARTRNRGTWSDIWRVESRGTRTPWSKL